MPKQARPFWRWSVAFMLFGHSGAIAGGPAATAQVEPLSYYLPVHDAEVSIMRTTQYSASYSEVLTFYGDMVQLPPPAGPDLLAPLGKCLWAQREKQEDAKSELSLIPRVDAAVGPIPISTASSSWVDFESSVSLSPEGFLAGVNVVSEGRGPQVIQSVMATAGRVLALGAGVGLFALVEGGPSPEEAKRNALLKTSVVELLACERRFVDPEVQVEKVQEKATKPGALEPNPCNPFDPAFLELPERERWVLGSTSAACGVFLKIQPAAKAIATAFVDLDAARSAPVSSDLKAEYARKVSIERLLSRYEQAAFELATLQKSLAQLVAGKLAETKLAGSASRKEELLLPLDRLCPASRFQRGALTELDRKMDLSVCAGPLPAGMAATDLDCQCARGHLAQKGAALVAETTGAVTNSLSLGIPSIPASETPGKRQTFFFRQPVPMTFQLVSVGDDEVTPRVGHEQTLLALHPRSRPRGLGLDMKAMSKGSIALSLSSLGVPTTIRVSRTSSAAGWAGAIAEGTKTLRDEYKATVEALVAIEEKQRELQLSDLSDEIARLKKEKEILDQSVAFDVAEGSYESLVARQKLENDLALLESQLRMKVAEDTLDLRATTQTLAAELAQVVQELELVKKRLELAEAESRR